jgi:serine/threonine protein kinase
VIGSPIQILAGFTSNSEELSRCFLSLTPFNYDIIQKKSRFMNDSPSRDPMLSPSPPPEALTWLTTQLKAGGYQIRDYIGAGGFSAVYSVHSIKYDRAFAAKITNITNSVNACGCARESYALQRLHHPNIVNLYDSWTSGDYSFMILEMCSPISLKHLIVQAGGNPVPNFGMLMGQLCEAVFHLHSHGIAHRDIKPANVLIDAFGRAKLADFGFAIPVHEQEKSTERVGTLHYLAPEVLRGLEYDPFKSDIWALGITLYEMYKGLVLWPKGADVAQIVAFGGLLLPGPLPFRLSKVVQTMTRMNPGQRPLMDEILATGDLQLYPTDQKLEAQTSERLPVCGQRSMQASIRPMVELMPRASSVRTRGSSQGPPLQRPGQYKISRGNDRLTALLEA